MPNRICVWLAAGALLSACGSPLETGKDLNIPPGEFGGGGPRQPSGINVNTFLTMTYGPETDITITDVRPVETAGPVEIVDWYVVDGIVTDADWGQLSSEQHMARLEQRDHPHVRGCPQPFCDLTIGLAIGATDNANPGAVKGFEIQYENASGKQYVQRVGFTVYVCLPERPECTDEF